MDGISVTASIIAVLQLTAAVIDYLNNVKDAPKDCVRFAIEAANLYNLLVQFKFRFEEGKCNETWYTAVIALGVENGPLDQYKHALEKLQAKVTSGSGLKKIGNALTWIFGKGEVISIISRVERLKSLIQIALEMDHFKLSQAIKSYVDSIHNDNQTVKKDINFVRNRIPALEDGVNALHQNENRRQDNEMMEWISSTNFPAQQSDLIDRVQEGTGKWFLKSPEFAKWFRTPSDALYCPGIPGAGKTMIAAITIDYLTKHVQSDAIGVAYIYCNYKAQADQTAASLLAAVLKQLVHAQPCIAEPVSSLYKHHAPRNSKPSLEEIFSVLKSAVKNYSTVYLVLDALDECSYQDGTRNQLLTKFHDLQKEGDLRVMITSRFIHDIEKKFKLTTRLEIRANDMDVKRFVERQIYRLPNCVQRDKVLQEFVQDKIVQAADGMFLLARLHIDSLQDKRTKSKIQSTLEQFSRGSKSLDQAYEEAIQRIEAQLPEYSALGKMVLSWVAFSERPLTPGELCHALAVEIGKKELDYDNILDVEDILSVCAGLTVVDEQSNIIRLVHYTTQEYFERIRESWNPTAQKAITLTCLTYLSFNTFRSGSCPSDKDLETRLKQYAFLNYAVQHWGQHAQTVQEQVSDLASIFLQNYDLVSCAVQIMKMPKYKFKGYSQKFPGQTTGLHLTAALGLQHLLQNSLSLSKAKSDIPTDSRDSDGRTPLSWAAEHGQEAVVKLLLERDDVDANLKDEAGRTPLWWAAQNGQEAVVKLLLERDDVDADLKDKYGRTPLWWAARNGREAVVKLLLKRGDVDAGLKDQDGQTPLWCAAWNGHEAMVKLLLERDDVDAASKDNWGETALSVATRYGHKAVVELLWSGTNS